MEKRYYESRPDLVPVWRCPYRPYLPQDAETLAKAIAAKLCCNPPEAIMAALARLAAAHGVPIPPDALNARAAELAGLRPESRPAAPDEPQPEAAPDPVDLAAELEAEEASRRGAELLARRSATVARIKGRAD